MKISVLSSVTLARMVLFLPVHTAAQTGHMQGAAGITMPDNPFRCQTETRE